MKYFLICIIGFYSNIAFSEDNNNSSIKDNPLVVSYDLEKNIAIPKDLDLNTISCGLNFCYGISNTKQLYVIGSNSNYQLGTKNKIVSKWRKTDQQNVISVVAGSNFGYLIKNKEKSLYVIGSNDNGELGLGSFLNQKKWVKTKYNDVKSIFASKNFGFFILENGDSFSTGNNEFSQLGFPNTKSSVLSLWTKTTLKNINYFSLGLEHSYAINKERIFVSGRNQFNQLGVKTKLKHSEFWIQLPFYESKNIMATDYSGYLINYKNDLFISGKSYYSNSLYWTKYK